MGSVARRVRVDLAPSATEEAQLSDFCGGVGVSAPQFRGARLPLVVPGALGVGWPGALWLCPLPWSERVALSLVVHASK